MILKHLLLHCILIPFFVGCTSVGSFHREVVPITPVVHSRDLDFYDYQKISGLIYSVPGLIRFVDTLDDEVFDAKFGLPQDHALLVLRKHVSDILDDYQVLDIEFGSNTVRRSFSIREAMYQDYSDDKVGFLHFSVLSESSILLVSEKPYEWSKHSVHLNEFNRNTNTIDSYDHIADETLYYLGKQQPSSRSTFLSFADSEFRVFELSRFPESMKISDRYLDGLLISVEWGSDPNEVCIIQINQNKELTIDYFDISVESHLRRLKFDVSELLTGMNPAGYSHDFNTLMSPDGRYLCISHNSGLLGLANTVDQSFITAVSKPQWTTDGWRRHIFTPTDWTLDSEYVMLIAESEVFVWDIVDFFYEREFKEPAFSQDG